MSTGLTRHRTSFQVLYDSACWAVAVLVAILLRYDLDFEEVRLAALLRFFPVILAAQVLAGVLFGMYRGHWRFGSFEEVLALVKGVVLSSGLVFLVNIALAPSPVPRSVPLGAGIVAFVLMGGGRYAWRLGDERHRRPTGPHCERLLVFGAGEGGSDIIRAMLSNREGRYLPVALLDDDPHKRNLRIQGVPVVGGRQTMAKAAADHRADAVLIAVRSASAALVTEISELAFASGLGVKVLPPVNEMLGDRVATSDIRDVTAADLLGRHEIHTDVDAIAEYLTGKRVLVTGAGGSIGSELCRQIFRFAPAQLVMVDRDESALHGVQLSIEGRALLDTPDLVLLDLRDHAGVERLVAERRPEVVFHAAALKHLPMLERYPAEAVMTNVWATLNLLEAAVAAGVERLVNISTDKAADPSSVLGYSKRITERLTAHAAEQGQTVCMSVRFGNVLGSRGSVLTTFQAQIDGGGPLTVTHPDVSRYFMTIEEAVELVIQAGAIGGPGEVLVLDMGEPVRIADVARLLASRSARQVSILYTGLREGEKLHEVLLGPEEIDRRVNHPLISHVAAPPLDPALVRNLDVVSRTPAELVGDLAGLCRHGPALVRGEG